MKKLNSKIAEILLEKAYENIDIVLLKEAIACGADVNAANKEDDSLFETMIWEHGSSYKCGDRDERYLGENMYEFIDILLEHGLDINHFYKEDGKTISTFSTVARWCHNKKLLEYLLQRGMNPNVFDDEDDFTALEDLLSDIDAEEMCCDDTDFAAWLYNACRLAIGYGAKPICMLRPEEDDRPYEMVEAARNLDCEKLKEISAEEIIKYDLCQECTYFSKFANGHDFYYNQQDFDRRLSEALDVIIDKIGVHALDRSTLYNCVEDQFKYTLKHLLERGVDPNINSFNEYYSWVKSSALYELESRGNYMEDADIARDMRDTLIKYGARVK